MTLKKFKVKIISSSGQKRYIYIFSSCQQRAFIDVYNKEKKKGKKDLKINVTF